MNLSAADIMAWKNLNMELHECISNLTEIDLQTHPLPDQRLEKWNQKFAHITLLCKQIPQRGQLPMKGTMYCRLHMLRVISINLVLIFANPKETMIVGYIQELLEQLMQDLGTLWISLQRGGFQENIYSYSTWRVHDAMYSEHEQHLFISEDVPLKFSHMQQLLFKKRIHFALAYQYHSLSKERKVLELECIKNSFQMHVDAHTFQKMSSYIAFLVSSTDLKDQKLMEELDPPCIFSGINVTMQQLEKALIPPPPVLVKPYPFNDEQQRFQISPDTTSIRSSNNETKSMYSCELDNESNEELEVSNYRH